MRKLTLQRLMICCLFLLAMAWPVAVWAQDEPAQNDIPSTEEDEAQAPEQVNVEPTAQDEQIADRLLRILVATEWFVDPTVQVRDGVAFLDGQARSEDRREWAGNLARSTQDVVAVVNRIEVIPRSLWDFSPAFAELRSLWRQTVRSLPVLVFGIAVLVLSWWLTKFIVQFFNSFFRARIRSRLLGTMAARAIAIPVFLLGVYLVLQVAGLTRLAVTVLGGTGLVGIVVGFAFRDIAENFLASLLLSLQQPFHRNDLIEVVGHIGIVQQMNTRSTVLMTLDGNHVQIPNAIIFKNTITNYTANPNRRSDFMIRITYNNVIQQVQQVIAQVLNDHPAVFKTPEPLVLVDQLAVATVDLRIFFWYDATQYGPDKIKSSLLRLIRRALQDGKISMPSATQDINFPNGVPIFQAPEPQSLQQATDELESSLSQKASEPIDPEPLATDEEGDLRPNEEEIREQAEQSRVPEEGEDLLEESRT